MTTALLIVDVQHLLCVGAEAAHAIGPVVERINRLSATARTLGLPVILVQHEEVDGPLRVGSEAWQLYDRLVTAADDLRVSKTYGDSFQATNLQSLLQARSVDRVIVCGLQSDHCVAATVRGAHALGYAVTLVCDAHSTMDSQGSTAPQLIQLHNQLLAQLASVELMTAATLCHELQRSER